MKKTMVGPWSWPTTLKLKLLHVFSMKLPASSSSSSSSSTSSTKLKTLIHTFIFSFAYRITPFFSKSKSVFLCIITHSKPISFINHCRLKTSKISNANDNEKKKNKLLFGSFRLHYNWGSSSHVMPAPAPEDSLYYDSTWNSLVSTDRKGEDHYQSEDNSKLSGYLEWLEEREFDKATTGNANEIDQMAELFILKCHEKFQLEKQESYRRFQEMLARST